MSAELIHIPERKILRPNFSCVVADDVITDQVNVDTALKKDFPSIGAVHLPHSGIEILNQSLTGNLGGQVDVVFLDENFGLGIADKWSVSRGDLEVLARVAGANINSYLMLVRPDTDWLKELYKNSSGTDFAILLRLLGFKGDIYSISNNPPRPRELERNILALKNAIPGCTVDIPFAGVLPKDGHDDRFAFGIQPSKFGQDWEFITGANSLAEAVQLLLLVNKD